MAGTGGGGGYSVGNAKEGRALLSMAYPDFRMDVAKGQRGLDFRPDPEFVTPNLNSCGAELMILSLTPNRTNLGS